MTQESMESIGLMSNSGSSSVTSEEMRRLPKTFASVKKNIASKIPGWVKSDKMVGAALIGGAVGTAVTCGFGTIPVAIGITLGAYLARPRLSEVFQNLKHFKNKDNRHNALVSAGQFAIEVGMIAASTFTNLSLGALLHAGALTTSVGLGTSAASGMLANLVMGGITTRGAAGYVNELNRLKRPIPLEQIDPKSDVAFQKGHEVMALGLSTRQQVSEGPVDKLSRLALSSQTARQQPLSIGSVDWSKKNSSLAQKSMIPPRSISPVI